MVRTTVNDDNANHENDKSKKAKFNKKPPPRGFQNGNYSMTISKNHSKIHRLSQVCWNHLGDVLSNDASSNDVPSNDVESNNISLNDFLSNDTCYYNILSNDVLLNNIS